MFVILWEYEVKPGYAERFETVYGPQGDWVRLFACAARIIGSYGGSLWTHATTNLPNPRYRSGDCSRNCAATPGHLRGPRQAHTIPAALPHWIKAQMKRAKRTSASSGRFGTAPAMKVAKTIALTTDANGA